MSEKDLKRIPLKDKMGIKFEKCYTELFRMMFSHKFIPIMKEFQKELGEKKLIEILSKASCNVTEYQVKMAKPNDDFETFKSPLKANDGFFQHTLTYDIIEDTDTAFEVKTTECLWANIFREADAADIGFAAICNPDDIAATTFNRKMKLIRTKTLMEGHDCCNHRWMFEE